ncbi:MAG TPA: cytochrome c biogenesis protein CcsA, partial [Microthrixaceae bacterium]|nr:cytochrome c biogenesis protein CcsA [Microthrixaceae bacterium]
MTTPAVADLGKAAPGTGSIGTRALGATALVSVALGMVYGLIISPPDAQLGNTIRIIYLHVPTVLAAYMAFIVTAVGSVMYLWKRSEFWDLLAASAAEIGVLFFTVTIIDGALWGKVTWGVFWRWEPRLTTSAVLLIMYLGYLAVRQVPADARTRATRCAVVGLVA